MGGLRNLNYIQFDVPLASSQSPVRQGPAMALTEHRTTGLPSCVCISRPRKKGEKPITSYFIPIACAANAH